MELLDYSMCIYYSYYCPNSYKDIKSTYNISVWAPRKTSEYYRLPREEDEEGAAVQRHLSKAPNGSLCVQSTQDTMAP